MTEQAPSVGRIVHYTVGDGEVRAINELRGNTVQAGDVLAAVIVRVWSVENGCANLRVLLDGPDVYWATSRVRDPGGATYQGGTWHWPERV